MAKREVLGHMDCPECGLSGAEVKPQKNGLAYRWCPECNAQYFPRTEEASARLLKKARASVPVTGTEPERRSYEGQRKVYEESVSGTAAPVPEQVPEQPKKRGSGNVLLDLIQGVGA